MEMYLITLLQIVCLFIVPVVLLYTGVIPGRYRLLVLGVVSAIILGITIQEQWTLQQLGIRLDSIGEGIAPYLVFTVAGLIVIFGAAKLFHRYPVDRWWTKPHFVSLFLPISVLQEVTFRGFLMPKLESVLASALLAILVNALLFAFLHILYPQPRLNVPFGFLAGIGFAALYSFFPNLILISLSHSVLNFFAVLFGFFSFPEKRKPAADC